MRHAPQLAVAVATLLLCSLVTSTPMASNNSSAEDQPDNNYNCPEDCQCNVPSNANTQFLHAKCWSIKGLAAPLHATLPIHSIDLSYLRLPRLSHALEHLHDVTSVDLSHNELHEIGHLGRRIKKLNLKHNRFTSAKLGKLPQHVQVLNLQHNDITYLPLEFTKLTQLHTLELSHNQINCSCETLEVRNWLQERQVFMEHPIVCSYPSVVKGQSWLQVKQQDICRKEKRGWYGDEDENEVMLGDQAVEGSGEDNEDEDELGKAFIRLDDKSATTVRAHAAELRMEDVEGSGDLSEFVKHDMNLMTSTEDPQQDENTTTDEPEDDEGSGSGGGILIIPHGSIFHDELDNEDTNDLPDEDDDYDNKPVEEPAHEATPSPEIFGTGMGIFDTNDEDDDKTTGNPDVEAPIVPAVHYNVEVEATEGVTTEGPNGENAAILRAKVGEQEDSNATYFLLGVIGLIIIGLLFYVGIKRCKHNRDGHDDVETARQTELLDMDKKNLGKPVHRNGNEHAPLIAEKSKADLAKPINGSKPYDSNDAKDGPGQQQPLLNGNGTSNGNGAAPNDTEIPKGPVAHEYYPITPRYPTPQSPRASKYAQHPQGEHNNNNMEDAYLPSSPKSGRYSPVYSPETGRVKIKLTETPKPKTPMLVTRSKSNAGDIITTPVHQSQLDASLGPAAVAVTNGHVNH